MFNIKTKIIAMIIASTLSQNVDATIITNYQTEIQTVSENSISDNAVVGYEQETYLSDEDFQLLADVVMAESEDQSFEAQYAVACVILNRCKSPEFPDTIYDVVYQIEPNKQFSSMHNGRYSKIVRNGGANDSCMEAVQSACEMNDSPPEMLYFTSNGYLKGTKRYLQIDDMYFSLQQ